MEEFNKISRAKKVAYLRKLVKSGQGKKVDLLDLYLENVHLSKVFYMDDTDNLFTGTYCKADEEDLCDN